MEKARFAALFAAGAGVGVLVCKLCAPSGSAGGAEGDDGKWNGMSHSQDQKWGPRSRDPTSPDPDKDFWVEVYDEPRHALELETPQFRVIRFKFPPGAQTRYHRHKVDSFFVFFNSAKIRNESLGAKPAVFPIEAGGAAGACYCDDPVIHRISNIGNTWMHGLDIEIVSTTAKGYTTPPLQDTKELQLVYDKDELNKGKPGKPMRVYRLTVGPGQTADVKFDFSFLSMCQSGSSIRLSKAGAAPETAQRYKGSYAWEQQGFVGSIENIGSSPYVAFIAEWY